MRFVRPCARPSLSRAADPWRLVHALVWALFDVSLGPAPSGRPDGGFRRQAERSWVTHWTRPRRKPRTYRSPQILDGGAAAVLLHSAGDAELVVIGDRGLGGFSGLVLGSVAVQVAEEEELVLAESLAGHRPVPAGARHSRARTCPTREGSGRRLQARPARRGRRPWPGWLHRARLGSVSHAVLHHSHSPLAIVRHRRTDH